MRAVVITVSDRAAQGERPDASGPRAVEQLETAGFEVAEPVVVADEIDAIVGALRAAVSRGSTLVVTTGGTGLAPRDVTPEATKTVIEREVPGLVEALRAEGRRSTPFAALSRAVAGTTGTSLVVNLPGSPTGVEESLQVLLPLAHHALEVLAGTDPH